jgi:hypothetical protein
VTPTVSPRTSDRHASSTRTPPDSPRSPPIRSSPTAAQKEIAEISGFASAPASRPNRSAPGRTLIPRHKASAACRLPSPLRHKSPTPMRKPCGRVYTGELSGGSYRRCFSRKMAFVVPTILFKLLYGLLILSHAADALSGSASPRIRPSNGSPK